MEQSETGAVRSQLEHKGTHGHALRFDLLLDNSVGIRRLAETYGEGFAKYGAGNWKKGFKESVLLNHAMEHLVLYVSGDTTEDHLAHATWNLFTLMWMQEKKPELLDLTAPNIATLQNPSPQPTVKFSTVLCCAHCKEPFLEKETIYNSNNAYYHAHCYTLTQPRD